VILTTAEYLRMLADLVERGEVEVGRIELRTAVVFGTFQPGTFAAKELQADAVDVDRRRRRRF